MITETKTIYITKDGREFEDKARAKIHEQYLSMLDDKPHSQYIHPIASPDSSSYTDDVIIYIKNKAPIIGHYLYSLKEWRGALDGIIIKQDFTWYYIPTKMKYIEPE